MNATDPFVDVAAGSAIFREGERGDEMYIIESGTVDLVRQARGSEPVATFEAGECFGEMALLEEQPRFATAIARTNVRLLKIERAAFADVMRSNVEIPIRIMRKLVGRLRRSEQRALDAHLALGEFKRKLSARRDADPAPASPQAESPRPSAEPPVAARQAAAPPPVAAPREYRLRLDSGEVFALNGGNEFLVGRPDPASGINPEINLGPYDTARSLSRRHAKLVLEGDRCLVREDAATTNGTYVNGERIQTGVPVALKPGDKLKFGSVEVELVA
ncbi:MAG TPA: cyclic nucleotide-binding domain-containing protein [Candidatus Saccharimonadia bacterium]|nr:cyclic nucleotide-binding domain-containing protein [Candidatus Saccharimonadia bacterium]